MAAPNVIRSPAGLRWIQLLEIAADGYPAATSTTVYEGVQLQGAKTLGLEDPAPREIVHRGDDRPYATQTLPPSDPVSGSITTSKINDTVDALMTNKISLLQGEAYLMGFGTDRRGEEVDVILLAFRQARTTDIGSASLGDPVWDGIVLNKTRVIPNQPGMGEADEDTTYTVVPTFTSKYPWGLDFVEATDGYERAQGFRIVTQYKPWFCAWQGDNSTTEFTFHASRPAQATTKIHGVWVDGAVQTGGGVDFTEATTGITFEAASTPGTDANIFCFYEFD